MAILFFYFEIFYHSKKSYNQSTSFFWHQPDDNDWGRRPFFCLLLSFWWHLPVCYLCVCVWWQYWSRAQETKKKVWTFMFSSFVEKKLFFLFTGDTCKHIYTKKRHTHTNLRLRSIKVWIKIKKKNELTKKKRKKMNP